MFKQVVAVVFSGSDASLKAAEWIIPAIPAQKYDVLPIYVGKSWYLYDGNTDNIQNIQWEKFGTPAVLSPDSSHRGILRIVGNRVKTVPVDVVFDLVGLGESWGGLPVTGCGCEARGLSMDPIWTRLVGQSVAPQRPFEIYWAESDESGQIAKKCVQNAGKRIKFPLNVISRKWQMTSCSKRAELSKHLHEQNQDALIEAVPTGKPLCVGVLGNKELSFSSIGEINKQGELNTIELTEDKQQELLQLAARVYRAFSGRGMGVVFFEYDSENDCFYFKGFDADPLLKDEARQLFTQWNTSELVDRMIRLSLERD